MHNEQLEDCMATFRITIIDPYFSVDAVGADKVKNQIFRNHPVVAKFMKYEEYVTIEFDTDARTARVVPVEED